MTDQKSAEQRTQDLGVHWHDAGQFYWGKSEAWMKNKTIFNASLIGYELSSYCAQDIDTPEDLEHARKLSQVLGLESAKEKKN